METYTQNSFSRVAGNDAKMGYFPTDLTCVSMIKEHLIFPEDEINALDPCVGEGLALKEITQGEKVNLLGIELDSGRALASAANGIETKEGSFLSATITPQSLPFLFMNPPYGYGDGIEREELTFLRKAAGNLCKNGILVLVVPDYIVDRDILRFIISRFKIERVLKFPEKVYKDFKQIAIILRRVANNTPLRPEVDEVCEKWPTLIEDLVKEEDCTPVGIPIPYLNPSVLVNLHTQQFDAKGALEKSAEMLKASKTYFLEDRLKVEDKTRIDVGHPLMDLKPDLKYLMIASGVCQGAIMEGTPYEHYQRGTVKVVEDIVQNNTEEEDGESSGTVTVTSHAKITMTVVERDGTITDLM